MTAIACPYCGAALNQPLKFCLACGRGVSKSDMKRLGGLKSSIKAGATKRLDEGPTSSNFDLARRDSGVQRNMRQILASLSYVMVIILVIYFAGNYILSKARETPPLPQPTAVEGGAPAVEPATAPPVTPVEREAREEHHNGAHKARHKSH